MDLKILPQTAVQGVVQILAARLAEGDENWLTQGEIFQHLPQSSVKTDLTLPLSVLII